MNKGEVPESESIWFWDVSPKFWTPFQWGVVVLANLAWFAIMLFGCGIESIVEILF